MSARNSQSDTSRVVKNPLLSAVAGSIDDFVNNSILLPAAEIPVAVLPPSQSHETENRDVTKSVIYGTEPPAVLDSDKFSEISLDQTVDVDLTTTQTPQEYNPLQNLDTFLPVAAEQQQQQQQQRDDTIFTNPLAQATAIKDSLSQLPGVLPGVASTVFSSFSSILKGRVSPGKESISAQNPTTYSNQLSDNQEATSVNQYNPYFYDQSTQQQQQQPEVPPIVPTFYSPTDPNIVRPEASLSPSSAENHSNNLYRLKERRKIYAPIPGLNANAANLIPTNPNASPAPIAQQQPPVATNQNTSFSLSSFFSGAPILDKVLQKSPEPSQSTSHQESFQPVPKLTEFATAPVAAQFFDPNQFSVQTAESQTPQSGLFSINQSISEPSLNSGSSFHQQSSLPPLPPPPSVTSSTSFNLNPFQKISAPQQAPASFATTQQIFTPSLQGAAAVSGPTQPIEQPFVAPVAVASAPPPPTQFYNPNQFTADSQKPQNPNENTHSSQSPFTISGVPSSQTTPILGQTPAPIATPPPIATQFYNPNQFSAPNPSQTAHQTNESFHPNQPSAPNTPSAINLSSYQTPPFPNPPPASTSPALAQQAAIPNTFLPPSAVPPTGQSVNYRLQGKPLYRKPIQATQIANQSPNPSTVQLFNPSASLAAPVLEPSSQIFSPFDNSQTYSPNTQITSTPSVPIPSIPTPLSQPENIPTQPVSIFNPFSQTQVSQDSKQVYPSTVSPAAFSPNYQAKSPPSLLPPSIVQPTIVPQSEPVVFNETVHPISNTNQPSLGSFFGKEDSSNITNSEIKQPIANDPVSLNAPSESEPVAEQIQLPTESEIVLATNPSSVASEQTKIQNFFESTPFDPFKQTHTDYALNVNTIPTNLNDDNANVEVADVNSGIQDLSLDNENNIIEEIPAQPVIETSDFSASETAAYNPISFFNNNPTETIEADPSNAFQIQSFFNEPPPLTEVQENVQEKNFNFIRTNLLNKRIERIANAETASPETLSIASLIAEPASSAQSELSYIEPSTADVTAQSFSESIQNNQDQADGINIFNWLDKQEATEMTTTQVERTSTPATSTSTNIAYRPVYKHWFYKTSDESKKIWIPFSFPDSMLLEEAFITNDREIVTTDGGRFDVNIKQRTRNAVYWTAESNEVRRCSWFYKGIDFRLIPYEEEVAEHLEDEYRDASHTGEWQRKIPLTSGETVIFNGPSDILHFLQSQSTDSWNNGVNTEVRPRAVKRGTDEFAIDDGEPEQIDHLLFMVHGIGSACDIRFRKVEEVVDEFRSIASQLVQSHYRSSCDRGIVGRVEVLPISWHTELHSEESGIDEKLKAITLESIPKLRNFTNDTLLDILFYTSPVFCQQIIEAVAGNMNKCYIKFCERNPDFHGSVSVSGHSLGSVILFDLLQHQRIELENSENLDTANRVKAPLKRHCSQQINYTIGHAGTGQPYISYPQLSFQPKHFFALGSPIGMFVTIRGIDALGLQFKLPTTDQFFNIFHPYDPVAYRIEALVNPELQSMRPVLVPHHKGRKRMHIELRETVARVGADIKQKILQTLQSTIDTVYSYTIFPKGLKDTKAIQQEVNKVIDEQLTLDELETSANTSSASSEIYSGETDLALGKINGGRRIDYVLQEAPLEIINEYLFALTSHVCYWSSEDVTLFIIKEIYSSLGIPADTKIPQPTMTIERPSPANSVKSSPTTS